MPDIRNTPLRSPDWGRVERETGPATTDALRLIWLLLLEKLREG